MPCPFPGMDPFIEINPRWESFHAWFIRKLAEQTMPQAEALGCWIDVERAVYQRDEDGEVILIGIPDHTVATDASSAGWKKSHQNNGGVALAAPSAVHEAVLDPEDPEVIRQDYLVVRELDQFQQVLAVVEVLSPSNKSGDYAKKYREKRRRFLLSNAHFMEIDFLRGGENPSRDLFPELSASPYFIYVARKTSAGRNEEGYPLRLQDPLPMIGLPLGSPRPDLPLDLPAAFRAAYDLAIRRGSIRYQQEQPPAPPLTETDAAWVREIVNSMPSG